METKQDKNKEEERLGEEVGKKREGEIETIKGIKKKGTEKPKKCT
jgi:hypothetical protein